MKENVLDIILQDESLIFDGIHKSHSVFHISLYGSDYYMCIHTYTEDFIDWYTKSDYLKIIKHEWDYRTESTVITEEDIDFDIDDVYGEQVIEYIAENKDKLFGIEITFEE